MQPERNPGDKPPIKLPKGSLPTQNMLWKPWCCDVVDDNDFAPFFKSWKNFYGQCFLRRSAFTHKHACTHDILGGKKLVRAVKIHMQQRLRNFAHLLHACALHTRFWHISYVFYTWNAFTHRNFRHKFGMPFHLNVEDWCAFPLGHFFRAYSQQEKWFYCFFTSVFDDRTEFRAGSMLHSAQAGS